MSHITESEADIPHNSVNQPRIHLENLFCVCDGGRWSTSVYAAESPKVLKWNALTLSMFLHAKYIFRFPGLFIHALHFVDFLTNTFLDCRFNHEYTNNLNEIKVHKIFIFKNVSALQNILSLVAILFWYETH